MLDRPARLSLARARFVSQTFQNNTTQHASGTLHPSGRPTRHSCADDSLGSLAGPGPGPAAGSGKGPISKRVVTAPPTEIYR